MMKNLGSKTFYCYIFISCTERIQSPPPPWASFFLVLSIVSVKIKKFTELTKEQFKKNKINNENIMSTIIKIYDFFT